MFYVYIIQNSADKSIYVGYTADLRRRLREHREGFNRSTRRRRGNWELIYYEAFRSEEDARIRERRLKHHGKAFRELSRRLENSMVE